MDELRNKLHDFIPAGVPAQCLLDDMEIRLDESDMLELLLDECSQRKEALVLPIQIQIRIGREDTNDDFVEIFVGSFAEIASAANKILPRGDYTYDMTLEDGSLISNAIFDCAMLSEGKNVVTLTNIQAIVEEEKERDRIHSELRQWLRSAMNSLPNDLLSALCAAFTSEGITTVALLKSLAANGRSEVLELCSDIAGVRNVRQRGFRRGHKTLLVEAILGLADSEPPRDEAFAAEAGLEGYDELKSEDTAFQRPAMSDPSVAHGINVSLVPLPRPDRGLDDQSEGSVNLTDSANLNVQIDVPETLIQLAPDEVVGTDVVCVVDVSGSMSKIAPAGPDGVDNKDGLSILDLVKHALKTVIGQLDGNDRFALVSFSTTAKLVFALEGMNEVGRNKALAALETMRPNNSTNIWAGLLQGMEAIRECDDGLDKVLVAGPPGLVEKTVVARRKTVMLLTDGMPNCEPPNGHLAELRAYLDNYPGFNFQLNTFGFGYGLNSDLLSELATEGGGTFAFIPDALIVGTVFVNTMANALSTFSQTATLSLIPKNGVTLAPSLPGFKNACAKLHEWVREGERAAELVAEESWGLRVKLGPLQMGQPRVITVPLNDLHRALGTPPEASLLEAVLQFPDPVPLHRGPNIGAAATVCNVSVQISVGDVAEAFAPSHVLQSLPPPLMEARKSAAVGVLRNEVVEGIAGAIEKAVRNDGESAVAGMDAIGKNLDARYQQLLGFPQMGEADEADARLVALKADVEGRSAKALQGKARFTRWGKHYLLAIARAHELRACTNFMDPGLQVYGGECFRDLRTKGDEMFLALPPPMKAIGSVNYRRNSGTGAAGTASVKKTTPVRAPAKVDMSGYYAGLQGGCFGGESTVIRVRNEGEETVHVTSIRAFDRVRMADGSTAIVRCVVVIPRAAGKELVEFAAGRGEFLAITPKHPVYVGGKWRLPREVVATNVNATDRPALSIQHSDHVVFNFLLEKGKHSMLVGGVTCATWGHGISGNIIEHQLFGNYDRVAELLAGCMGWDRGLVYLQSGGLVALAKKQADAHSQSRLFGDVKAMTVQVV